MLIKYLLGLILIGSIFPFAHARVQLTSENYFRLLDYDTISQRREILEFDESMIVMSERLIAKLEREGKLNEANPELGMILVYAGMFIVNTNNGIFYNKINVNYVSNVADDKGEPKLIARQRYAAELLHLARTLSPDDARIPAWESSAQFRIEILRSGSPSEETVNWIIDLVRQDPIFNLFNGLVLNNSVPFSTDNLQAMVDQAQIMTGIESPCIPINPANWFGNLRRCKTTSKTPYSYHGVMLLMGDSFMKIAQRYLDDSTASNDELAVAFMEKAIRIYNRPDANERDRHGRQWSYKYIIRDRVNLARRMLQNYNSSAVDEYMNSSSGAKMYQCYSCHQGGKGEEVFHPYYEFIRKR